MQPIILLIIGVFSGLHNASWGAYKDSPFEGFKSLTFLRSIFITTALSPVLYLLLLALSIPIESPLVFFAFILGIERILTEIYKAFFRKESQTKYAIPSQFHVKKKLISNPLKKLGYLTFVIGYLLSLFILAQLTTIFNAIPLLMGLFWGLIAGLFTDFGGALKDAPFEGFKTVKFFRSSVVSMVWGGLLSFLTTQYGLLFGAAAGLERMTVEFYKTFIVKHVPGKFKAQKPIYPEWVRKRKVFIVTYASTWAVFLLLAFV